MKKYLLIFSFSILIYLFFNYKSESLYVDTQKELLKYIIFEHNNGWGYDIYYSDKIIIHQKYIPSISGNIPFLSKDDAENVAQLVVLKIKKGKIPPTINSYELDSLNIINHLNQ